MIVYAISGLGADHRVFQFLKIQYPIKVITWEPTEGHTLDSYAKLLCDQLNTDQPFVLLGVSFGGMIAMEMNKYCSPKATILISSARSKRDLRGFYFMLSNSKLFHFLPAGLFRVPNPLAIYFFGARNTSLLRAILEATDLRFVKWALRNIGAWHPSPNVVNSVRIHGSEDRIIPLRLKDEAIVVPHGHHFMVVDRASEISQIVSHQLDKLSQ